MTPYYQDDACTIFHGDALEILPTLVLPAACKICGEPADERLCAKCIAAMPTHLYELSSPNVILNEHDAGSSRLESDLGTGSLGGTPASLRVDLAIVDPPYNAGFNYGDRVDDDREPDDYARWCSEWFTLVSSCAHRIVVFPGHGNMPVWWAIRKPSGFGCWHKPGNPAGGGIVSFCEWEPWLYWGPFLGGSDVIRATVSTQRNVGDHPCPKPLPLYRTLIHRTKAELTLDPFMGSGTTLRAAKDLGRKAIGIEIEERYCEIAANRLAQEVLPWVVDDHGREFYQRLPDELPLEAS